jgi:hypothetical protein
VSIESSLYADHTSRPVRSTTLLLGAWVTMPEMCRFGCFQGVKSQGVIARRPAALIYERAK